MKLSVRILTLLLCLSMLAGICSFGVSAAPAALTGTVKTDSAPIKIDGKETGATLTQYLLEKGSTYSTAADGLVSVVELELSDRLTMAVLNGGAYTWTKDTMGNPHQGQYNEVLSMAPSLVEGENAAFTWIEGAYHEYRAWGTGLYNFLRSAFY